MADPNRDHSTVAIAAFGYADPDRNHRGYRRGLSMPCICKSAWVTHRIVLSRTTTITSHRSLLQRHHVADDASLQTDSGKRSNAPSQNALRPQVRACTHDASTNSGLRDLCEEIWG